MLVIHFLTDSKSKVSFEECINKIGSLTNNWHSIIYPLLSAIFYILVFPFLRIGIVFLQAWFTRHSNEFELKGTKDGSVSVNKYISLRSEYLKKIQELQTLINSEDANRVTISTLENNIKVLDRREAEYRERKYPNQLFRFWDVTLKNTHRKTNSPEIPWRNSESTSFNIDAIELSYAEIKFYRQGSDKIIFTGTIRFFDFDKENGTIFMFCDFQTLVEGESKPGYMIFDLKTSKGQTILKGKVNDYFNIEMTARTFSPITQENSIT